MAPLSSDVARYDIEALAENAPVAKMQEMMKHLIGERFQGCAAHVWIGAVHLSTAPCEVRTGGRR